MSTRRALFFSFLDRYAALALNIVSSMFIARLLTPKEIGVFSVTMVLIMLLSAMRDLGAGQYLLQEKELTPDRIRATWAVLLITGAVMGVVVLAMAYPASVFYSEPRMLPIMGVIAFNFLISPFGSLTYAWLMREMKFESLAVMRFGSSLAGALTSIWLAYKHYGPISLAWGSLVATAVNAALAGRYRPVDFGWMPGLKEVRRVLSFGSKIAASGVTSTLAKGAPELFLGRMQGLTEVGLYSRGYGLSAMFHRLVVDATQSVAMPLFSKTQREVGRIDQPFLQASSYVTALGWSFFVGLGVLAYPLTRALYGWQWDSSVAVTRWLALGTALALPAAMCPQALLAKGQAADMLKITLSTVLVQIVLIGLGAAYSLECAAIGFTLSQAMGTAIWLSACKRAIDFRWRELVSELVRSGGVCAVTSASPIALVLAWGWRPSNSILTLLIALVAGCALFAGAAWGFKHPIFGELRRIADHMRERAQSARTSLQDRR